MPRHHQYLYHRLPALFLTFYVIKHCSSSPLKALDKREGKEDVNEIDTFFTRVDDMIFQSRRTKAGMTSFMYHWPNGVIPYEIQDDMSEEMTEALEEAMDLIETYTCIQFIQKTREENFVFISHTEKGCFSHVGMMINRGRQSLNLGRGCWRFGTIVHELIHTIGFTHMHQRNDRDGFIRIAYEHIEEGKQNNFKLDREMGLEFSTYNLPYNFASVMHYGPMAFSEDNDEPTIIPKKISELSPTEFWYSKVDEENRPVIGLRKLTWGDVKMINLLYQGECKKQS